MENFQHIKLKSSTTERSWALAGVGLMSAGILAVGYFKPSAGGIFPPCPFLSLTGFACPGCGLTRGFHALFHGDILGALDYNLLLPFYAFFFGYLFVSLFLTFARGRGLSFRVFKPWAVWTFFGLSFVFAILRNLSFYPFTILFP
jgi:hypothetical protein